jgi:hypothetical protein
MTKDTLQASLKLNKNAMNIITSIVYELIYEPRHDKTNIMGFRPAWIQTSLRFRAG